VTSPGAIAGNKASLPGAFNPVINSTTNITGSIKLANDGSTAPFPGSPGGTVGTTTDACQTFPAGFFTGQLALIDRGGGCGFTFKVKNAQDAGATGVIVANNAAGTISMGGVDPTITIMSLSITQADGNAIKAQLGVGVNATLNFTTLADTVSASTSRGSRRIDSGAGNDQRHFNGDAAHLGFDGPLATVASGLVCGGVEGAGHEHGESQPVYRR